MMFRRDCMNALFDRSLQIGTGRKRVRPAIALVTASDGIRNLRLPREAAVEPSAASR